MPKQSSASADRTQGGVGHTSDLPIARRSSLMRSMLRRMYMLVFKCAYRVTIRMGEWWEPILQEASPASGERILEVSAEGRKACATLARAYPAAHFFSVRPAGSNKSELETLSNLELLGGNRYCIDCRAASFDKVICSLVLHTLSEDKKLALLKEMRRVLRHGGTLYVADFDQPLRPMEKHVLRGTSYLFGPETARRHIDGTWLGIINQAGFVGVRRVTTSSEIGGRVAIVRARRA